MRLEIVKINDKYYFVDERMQAYRYTKSFHGVEHYQDPIPFGTIDIDLVKRISQEEQDEALKDSIPKHYRTCQ